MAHNPMFAKEYAEWGADVSVCGHTHGGLVRIPGIGSVISRSLNSFRNMMPESSILETEKFM